MERKSFSLLEYVLSTLRLSPKRKEVKSDVKVVQIIKKKQAVVLFFLRWSSFRK